MNSDTRFHRKEPSGHAGATQMGCDKRPVERFSRRSQVHRPAFDVRDHLRQYPSAPLGSELSRIVLRGPFASERVCSRRGGDLQKGRVSLNCTSILPAGG
jgi:hypothetical protein